MTNSKNTHSSKKTSGKSSKTITTSHTTSRQIRNKDLLARRRKKRQLIRTILICCAVLALIIIISLISRGFIQSKKGRLVDVNSEVLDYQSQVESACKKNHIDDFSVLMMAMMMQESGGQYPDLFQCSESPFNTEYENYPNSITDPDYSIEVAAETFAYCLEEANCHRLTDMDGVRLALQQYNYGNSYASWALENYGGYSLDNAYEYSYMMQYELGWESYGDPEYAEHVLSYFEY